MWRLWPETTNRTDCLRPGEINQENRENREGHFWPSLCIHTSLELRGALNQNHRRHHGPTINLSPRTPPVPVTLTPDQIAAATGCPARNVSANWPLILSALDEFGINTPAMQIAAAATVAVETGAFKPIRERHADPVRQPALFASQSRYWPTNYMGRGFVQLTWRGNYLDAGEALGVDLVGDPELAMDPVVAARVLACYLKTRDISTPAEAGDWKKVRRLVNGGTNGLDAFLSFVARLS